MRCKLPLAHLPHAITAKDYISVFITEEDRMPNYDIFDYCITHSWDIVDDRHYRYPCWATYANLFPVDLQRLLGARPIEIDFNQRKFCNYIFRNKVPIRQYFFDRLSDVGPIEAPSASRNNAPEIGGIDETLFAGEEDFRASKEKIAYQRNFRFSIAFENAATPGYTTEKILHAFLAGTVPIYWGDPLIAREFNPDAFIHAEPGENLNSVVEKVRRVNNDRALWMKMATAPMFANDRLPAAVQKEPLLRFFHKIFAQV